METIHGELKDANGAGGVVNTSTLAAHLGLSRWTVSRVLNEHPGVKAETRDRVMAAVRELGFEPNLQARSLRGLPTKLVGVSFQQFETPILAQKSAAMQKLLLESGYRGLFELPGWDPSMEGDVVRHFLSLGVDGIVLIGCTLSKRDEIFQIVRDRGVAMVAVDPRERLPIPQIELDRVKAMELKIDHLYKLGHRRFALLGIGSDDMYLDRRMAGLRQAIANRGLIWEDSVIEISEEGRDIQSPDYGLWLGRKFLKESGESATAILALNDRIALGITRAMHEVGKRIPEDYSLIGFDNLEESSWWSPRLTSIDQNIRGLMGSASEVLMRIMAGKKVPKVQLIEPKLIIRESTAKI